MTNQTRYLQFQKIYASLFGTVCISSLHFNQWVQKRNCCRKRRHIARFCTKIEHLLFLSFYFCSSLSLFYKLISVSTYKPQYYFGFQRDQTMHIILTCCLNSSPTYSGCSEHFSISFKNTLK